MEIEGSEGGRRYEEWTPAAAVGGVQWSGVGELEVESGLLASSVLRGEG